MPLTYKESESAPGRIRTSDSRFRKPSRFVYPCSPELEIRLSKPFGVRLCSLQLAVSTVKLLY
jgi:hypothetical protein